MLLRDFSKPVALANLIMWPFAFVATQVYVSIFIQQTGITATPFVTSLGVTLGIAWLAVIAQAARAAIRKPAEVLRYE